MPILPRLMADLDLPICRCVRFLHNKLCHYDKRIFYLPALSSVIPSPIISRKLCHISLKSNICRYIPSMREVRTPYLQSRDFTKFYPVYSNNGNASGRVDPEMVPTSKWLTIPNALTLFRMGISPYIGYLVLCEQFSWALGLVFLASVTDSIDGWIARHFKGQSSNIGSYIDPLADKILISILTVSLTMVNVIPVPLCGMIILRDILLVATSSHFHYKHLQPPKTMAKFFDFEQSKVKMEPTQISKYNTFLQLGLVTISMAAPVFNFLESPLLHAYWYLVASTTVLSGLSYVVKDKSAYKIK